MFDFVAVDFKTRETLRRAENIKLDEFLRECAEAARLASPAGGNREIEMAIRPHDPRDQYYQ